MPFMADVHLSHVLGCFSGTDVGIRSFAFVGLFTSAYLLAIQSACALLQVQMSAPWGRARVLRGFFFFNYA